MSFENPEPKIEQTKNPAAEVLENIFSSPVEFGLEHNIHPWPADETLAGLPEKFYAHYSDGSREFILLRADDEYFTYPVGMFLEKFPELENTDSLQKADCPRISDSDLPNYNIRGVNIAAIAGHLIHLQ